MIDEAKERAEGEFHIKQPGEKMFVAEAFAIQCNIVKGLRRHAREARNFMEDVINSRNFIYFRDGVLCAIVTSIYSSGEFLALRKFFLMS